MSHRSLFRLTTITCALVSLFGAKTALAQEKDDVRFRGAINLEGGLIAIPDVITLGTAGVSAQLGVQINHQIGVYVVPSAGAVFGDLGGVAFGAGLVGDYTFLDDMLTLGAGPEVGVFAAFGGSGNSSGASLSAAAGELYGARIHIGFNPVVRRADNGIRRKAFALALDVRMMGGYGGLAKQETSTSGTSQSAKVGTFVVLPTLSIGYQAF